MSRLLWQFEVLVILELTKIDLRSCEDCRELFSFVQVLKEKSHCPSSVQHMGQCLSISGNRFQQLSFRVAQLSVCCVSHSIVEVLDVVQLP